MDEIELLTAKQESFCVHYTTIGAETFGNGTKSAIAAEYSENSAYSQACNLLKNPKIQQRIKDLYAENMQRNIITVDKVLADLEHDKLMARQAGQYSVSYQCTVAQGKYLAMFADKHIVEANQSGEERLTREEWERERALTEESLKKLAAIDVEALIVR